MQLFVRKLKADRITGGADAYTFLGSANNVKHEGSKLMHTIGKLAHAIQTKLLKKTNIMVVG